MSKVIVLQDKNGETVYPVGIGSSLEAITDLFYPVGSYYETSDTSFDPNASWGGTWVEDTGGKTTLAANSSYVAGTTGGSTTHTISATELPTHTHTYSKSNTTTGSHTLTISEIPAHSHKFASNHKALSETGGSAGYGVEDSYSTSKTQIPTNSVGGGSGHTHGITLTSTDTGNGNFANSAMSIMQPYIVVKRWHRTA